MRAATSGGGVLRYALQRACTSSCASRVCHSSGVAVLNDRRITSSAWLRSCASGGSAGVAADISKAPAIAGSETYRAAIIA
jgi:hypothetical protein